MTEIKHADKIVCEACGESMRTLVDERGDEFVACQSPDGKMQAFRYVGTRKGSP